MIEDYPRRASVAPDSARSLEAANLPAHAATAEI
jgi:hypothetical protein